MLQRVLTLLFLCFCLYGPAQQRDTAILSLEDQWTGQDIYIINPISPAGIGFCVFGVKVNGNKHPCEINSSAFIIKLDSIGLKKGAPVLIEVLHLDGCLPKVVDPRTGNHRSSSFEILEAKFEEGGQLSWRAIDPNCKTVWVIERFRWNKWIKFKEVKSDCESDTASYSVQVSDLTGDELKVRLMKYDSRGAPEYSHSISYDFALQKVTFRHDRKLNFLTFSVDTNYELFDNYGNLICRGNGQKIDLNPFKKGFYTVNFGNQSDRIRHR